MDEIPRRKASSGGTLNEEEWAGLLHRWFFRHLSAEEYRYVRQVDVEEMGKLRRHKQFLVGEALCFWMALYLFLVKGMNAQVGLQPGVLFALVGALAAGIVIVGRLIAFPGKRCEDGRTRWMRGICLGAFAGFMAPLARLLELDAASIQWNFVICGVLLFAGMMSLGDSYREHYAERILRERQDRI